MNSLKLGLLFFMGAYALGSSAQNLLNLNDWVTGTGGTSGLTANGLVSENEREWGIGPLGTQVVLWKGTPSGDQAGDGGWNSTDIAINSQKTYRFSVWIKKTNSKSGTAYFGCGAAVTTLTGVVNNNAYFWNGNLPDLDKWYLLVGYVHGSSDPSTVSSGAIYDGITGKKIASAIDYKFSTTATTTRHRAYLFYDPNVNDRQYFYGPRLEEVNGNEPTISSLLNNPIGAGDFYFSGKVGIKTQTPGDYDLAVNGKIRGQEIKVEIAGWADYVFEEDYKLPTLTETEKFIQKNGHLPEVPKASEVEANGISLGEMNKILLKKIEELTLHLIEKDKMLKQVIERLEKSETALSEIKEEQLKR
ncbi:tail fiber protein [Sphingobacterium sp. Ag1]|uniref:tail fiber protein n=1 Tax=Sphingobacterium sp. Ag1 TaxID=1643451 RepID=UPI00069A5F4B|nr:tail fiber protein [Sphingobacterium sp. Ag1]